MPQRLSRTEFHAWAEQQPRGRFERVGGSPVAMAPERWVHARLKASGARSTAKSAPRASPARPHPMG